MKLSAFLGYVKGVVRPAAILSQYTSKFEHCAADVLGNEEGFANVRGDPGGRTWYGVTERYQPVYFHRMMMANTDEERRGISRECLYAEYWVPLRCEKWPIRLAYRLVDFGYLAGVGTAVKALQRACNEHRGTMLVVDGVLGRVTAAVVMDLSLRYERNLMGWFGYWCGAYLHGAKHPSGALWGWGQRLETPENPHRIGG